MRFLKRLSLNRRVADDNSLYVDAAHKSVVMGVTNSLTLPIGATSDRPASPTNGMIRYNTTLAEVELYQSNTWRSMRFKESTGITQQNLGAGDGNTVYFGPLNPVPPSVVQSGAAWGAQNVLVVVENVLQLATTNYTVVQNPAVISGEVYTGPTSTATAIGATTIYFDTALIITGASGTSTTATLTFTTQAANPFHVGSTIIVTGVTPGAYNGNFTVTAVSTTSVSYASTATGSMTFAGQVASTSAIYPASAANIVGATINGNASIQSATLISSYVTDPVTGALVSVVISKPTTTSIISAGSTLTITDGANSGTGYYLFFSSPVPYGKIVTALIGFDQ